MFPLSGNLVKIIRRRWLFPKFVNLSWLAGISVTCAIVIIAPHPGLTRAVEDAPLLVLATQKFPNLTRAERALLVFADKNNLGRASLSLTTFGSGQLAIAGISAEPLDPSNDPAHAAEWSRDRDIRAGLIRWLAVDNMASTLVDPVGVRVLGARIVGPIILAQLHVPFVLVLVRCSIPDEMNLESADLPYLTLSGSQTSRINALNLVVHSDLNMTALVDPLGNPVAPFESDMVNLQNAKIRGEANFNGAHFHYSEAQSSAWEKPLRIALYLTNAEIGGDLNLNWGFESRGCTFIAESTIGADLNCWGARFINPGNSSLKASGDDIKRFVFLGPANAGFATESQAFESDGIVGFEDAHVGAAFVVEHAVFGGKANELHGFDGTDLTVSSSLVWHDVILANGAFVKLTGASVSNALIWRDVTLTNGAVVDLSGAKVVNLFDEEKSWPLPGQLLIDGFTYDHFIGTYPYFPGWQSPVDARSRLRWLALQPGYRPDTYRQLAKVLRDRGDEAGAIRVRIAGEDRRYSQYGIPGRVWGTFLRYTIGYGHRPMLTIMWSSAVVLLGWAVVQTAKAASLMRPTYPENAPGGSERRYEKLHPLLYSLDVFLPFVNLHQEHYWWPDEDTSGSCRVLGVKLKLNGAVVLYYLWAQVMAGWILSAIFVAGVTGLIRND